MRVHIGLHSETFNTPTVKFDSSEINSTSALLCLFYSKLDLKSWVKEVEIIREPYIKKILLAMDVIALTQR